MGQRRCRVVKVFGIGLMWNMMHQVHRPAVYMERCAGQRPVTPVTPVTPITGVTHAQGFDTDIHEIDR